MDKLALRIAVAMLGLAAGGLGLAGVATAAPSDPSPASTAPASAGPAPVPFVYQPVDASDGLFGMRRGSVPTASTPDLSQVPIAGKLPTIGITPLPDKADSSATDPSETGVDESTADADQ
jgi:hypothetical protein